MTTRKENILPLEINVCDHYAGSVAFALKALAIQEDIGPYFDITLDLEDGAKKGNEEKLADDFLNLLLGNRNTFKKIGIRLPAFNHPLFTKLSSRFLSQASEVLNHITIPKINDYAHFKEVKTSLEELLKENTKLPPLHVLAESNSIIGELDKIAADESVRSLDVGIMDYVSSFHGRLPMKETEGKSELKNPLLVNFKIQVSLAAARNGKIATHSVCRDYQNKEQIENFCSHAKKLGFTRMWSIHPFQIPIIIKKLNPSEEEISEAQEILKSAKDNEWGPISYKGALHDYASYRYYEAILRRAKR